MTVYSKRETFEEMRLEIAQKSQNNTYKVRSDCSP